MDDLAIHAKVISVEGIQRNHYPEVLRPAPLELPNSLPCVLVEVVSYIRGCGPFAPLIRQNTKYFRTVDGEIIFIGKQWSDRADVSELTRMAIKCALSAYADRILAGDEREVHE